MASRSIGEAWRKPLGEPGMRATDAQLVLDGRLFVLAQQRALQANETAAELRLSIAAVSDGAQHAALRIPHVEHLAIAARRGLALAHSGDRLGVFDLRFGRQIRELIVPAGTTDIAVDEGMQMLALATPDGLDLVRPDSLVAPSLSAIEVVDAEESKPPEKSNGHDPAHAVDASAGEVVAVSSAAIQPPAAAAEFRRVEPGV